MIASHRVSTREEWLAAREALLKREKEHTRLGDELARERRELPWVRVEKDYRFQADDGEKSLAELFDGRSQLLVYHFMFGPTYQAGCPVNSSIADSIDGVVAHLHARDATLVLVSQTEEQAREAVAQVALPSRTLDRAFPPVVEQNARASGTDIAGYLTESPGFSTFVRDGDDVYQAYSTTW